MKILKVLPYVLFCAAAIFVVTYLSFFKNEENSFFANQKVKSFVPADDWFEKQRAFPFEEIPEGAYEKTISYAKQNISVNKNINASWALAGPINIEGRITATVIHPSNPQIVYTGTANGGIWKSTNFCQTWVSVFDNQNTSSIGSPLSNRCKRLTASK